jgi:hypothetical protein
MYIKSLLVSVVLAFSLLAGCRVGGGGPVCGDGWCDPGESSACSDCAVAPVCALEMENGISFFGVNFTIYEFSLGDGSGYYGSNLLGAPVDYNYFVSFPNYSPGYYDLLAIDSDGDWYEVFDFYCAPNSSSRWVVGALDCTTC